MGDDSAVGCMLAPNAADLSRNVVLASPPVSAQQTSQQSSAAADQVAVSTPQPTVTVPATLLNRGAKASRGEAPQSNSESSSSGSGSSGSSSSSSDEEETNQGERSATARSNTRRSAVGATAERSAPVKAVASNTALRTVASSSSSASLGGNQTNRGNTATGLVSGTSGASQRRRSRSRGGNVGAAAVSRRNGHHGDRRRKRAAQGGCGYGSNKSQSSSGSGSSSSGSGSDGSTSDGDGGQESEAFDSEEEVDREPVMAHSDAAATYKDLVSVKLPPLPSKETYTGRWVDAPPVGTAHFNDFAAVALRAGLEEHQQQQQLSRPVDSADGNSGRECPPLQPHQEVVRLLLQPGSPVSRLLVDHPTGSGKTREMISTLDNFFLDPRPKVPIFPKEPVCRNFYAELIRWPSRYRDFFSCLRPQAAARAAGVQGDWRKRRHHVWLCPGISDQDMRDLCTSMREVLEMKGWFFMGRMIGSRRDAFRRRFPEESLPAAPLRALRYTSAGGRHTELSDTSGLPASALLKILFDPQTKNVYSNKIVIMDEVHNLVRIQTQFAQQLERLRDLLFSARGMVLAGFTGTPILSEPWEGRRLLDIIKGRGAPACDEGYLSCFPSRPPALFARSLPVGVPDQVLTPALRRRLVQKVTLGGEPLQKYDEKRQRGLPERRLRAYCNLCVHFGSLHEGRSGSKARILGSMEASAPKLYAIAAAVRACQEKALVLVHRMSGMLALLDHLRTVGRASTPPFEVATMDELSTFNSAANLRGELFRVIVADATTCSEGVNFIAVRRVHLADVPTTPSAFVQSVGRAIRMYGHRGLNEEERTVRTAVYLAGLPRWLRSPLGAWALRAQKRRTAPREAESHSRRLLRRLFSVGIKDLGELKARIDKFGAVKAGASNAGPVQVKAPIQMAVMADFLESIGLWDEGKAMRSKAQQEGDKKPLQERKKARKQAAQGQAQPRAPTATTAQASVVLASGAAASEQGSWQRSTTTVGSPAAVAGRPIAAGSNSRSALASVDDSATLGSLAAAGRVQQRRAGAVRIGGADSSTAGVVDGTADVARADLSVWGRRQLYGALQALYLANDLEDAVERMRLSPLSADEEALRDLARRSREIVPALAELRSKAVDRAVLQLCVEQVEDESGGESTVHEFAVSASDGEVYTKKEAPLVLPPGWRMQKFMKKNRECREFVDPAGRRYKTFAQTRKAVNTARGMENMSQRLRAKYAAQLQARRGGNDGSGGAVTGTAPDGSIVAARESATAV
eukprot:TRINITY_DN2520_c0_g1_i1.p1 TRINITY_DN2520_c0_g1~~TRINITY_DN2520_c0_g1_i1.p1  ORF type:complete len:1256 (+),score=262.77 TRINITY_DN2520_c0_g1_i1:182-3949(+)